LDWGLEDLREWMGVPGSGVEPFGRAAGVEDVWPFGMEGCSG